MELRDTWSSGRVPAEYRFAGLDKRTFKPGFVVIALVLLWTVAVPALSRLLSYDQTTKAGDTFAIAGGITVTPAPGWGVEKGLLSSEQTRSKSMGETVVLVNGATTFAVVPGIFRGTAEKLLDQTDRVSAATGDRGKSFNINGDKLSIKTDGGNDGIVQTYTAINQQGAIAAFVFGQTGVAVTAVGPEAEFEANTDEVAAMIKSITYKPVPGAQGPS